MRLKLKPLLLIGPAIFLSLMALYGYYNYIHFGSPMKFSNTISRVRDFKNINLSVPQKGGDSVGALNTRNLLNGLISFTISHDRGILVYSPVIILFIFGLGQLSHQKRSLKILLIALPLSSLFTYSMFGDPYGGWAFGSRYMISTLPELLIISALGLQYFATHKSKIIKALVLLVYTLVFVYSSSVSLLAPLTTNVIPPQVEAGGLGLDSDYRINIRMLKNNELNSFIYNQFLSKKISGYQYYFSILIPLVIFSGFLIWIPKSEYKK